MASTSAASSLLFTDIFTTKEVDRDGKKFDRGASTILSTNEGRDQALKLLLLFLLVSRITARSSNHEMDLVLDVRTHITS